MCFCVPIVQRELFESPLESITALIANLGKRYAPLIDLGIPVPARLGGVRPHEPDIQVWESLVGLEGARTGDEALLPDDVYSERHTTVNGIDSQYFSLSISDAGYIKTFLYSNGFTWIFSTSHSVRRRRHFHRQIDPPSNLRFGEP